MGKEGEEWGRPVSVSQYPVSACGADDARTRADRVGDLVSSARHNCAE